MNELLAPIALSAVCCSSPWLSSLARARFLHRACLRSLPPPSIPPRPHPSPSCLALRCAPPMLSDSDRSSCGSSSGDDSDGHTTHSEHIPDGRACNVEANGSSSQLRVRAGAAFKQRALRTRRSDCPLLLCCSQMISSTSHCPRSIHTGKKGRRRGRGNRACCAALRRALELTPFSALSAPGLLVWTSIDSKSPRFQICRVRGQATAEQRGDLSRSPHAAFELTSLFAVRRLCLCCVRQVPSVLMFPVASAT